MNFNHSLIRVRRTKLKLTQDELAKLCGITPPTLSSFENGTSMPKTAIIDKLAIHLEMDPIDFFKDVMIKSESEQLTNEFIFLINKLKEESEKKRLLDLVKVFVSGSLMYKEK